ncbi:hypothetical protein V8B97DRAFT_1878730 [Scleroderma yunnanense]
MDLLTFQCWVYGQSIKRIFPVEVSKTKTVGTLRRVIKSEKPLDFRDVEADDLDLYKVPSPDDEVLEEELKQWTPSGKKPLGSRQRLSKLFPESEGEWLIIVHAPSLDSGTIGSSVMVLNCWVRGDEIERIFPVKISGEAPVGDLKEVIKNKKSVDFRDIDANNLALYNVSVPCNEDLAGNVERLTLDQEVYPWQTLSDIYTDPPLPGHLHIVIEPPSSELSTSLCEIKG